MFVFEREAAWHSHSWLWKRVSDNAAQINPTDTGIPAKLTCPSHSPSLRFPISLFYFSCSRYLWAVIVPFDYGEVRFFQMARAFFGRAVYWTGVYFVDGLLVDSGPPNLAREVQTLATELGVRQCITTHHHEDHSGNHRLLRERLGITPLAHARGVGRIAAPETDPQFYRRTLWGTPPPAEARAVGERLETPRFRFEVLHTPGHSEDHVSLWEPERGWLFSGDLYLAPKLKYLRADEDVCAMLDSLRRVVRLEPQALFCQHRGRVENGAALLRHKLDFLTELGGRIHELHRRGLPEKEIARRLPGSDLVWRVWTGGHFSKMNFVRAFLRGKK
jgi:glyoxylase-like metal-dependent hydrolase (beta-lactamase superfamily II)